MDGTVLDTLCDLTDAVNIAMGQAGHRHDFAPDEVRYFVGGGVGNAILRALAREEGAPLEVLEHVEMEEASPARREEAQRILAVFRPYYAAHCAVRTAPYPGIPALIAQLRSAGLRTALVSNKPDPSVQRLTELHFPGMFDFVTGERESVPRKPAPDMVYSALRALSSRTMPAGGIGADPQDPSEDMTPRPQEKSAGAVCIGDSEVDLQTAARAGLPCICVSWGFRGRAFLAAHGASLIVDTTRALGDLLLCPRDGFMKVSS